MCQEFRGTFEASPLPFCDGFPKLFCVPINDDGREQIQPSNTKVLRFGCLITD